METTEKELIKISPEYPLERLIEDGLHPYLKPKTLKIKAIDNTRFEGQTLSALPQGFFLGETPMSYTLPINGKTGELVQIFDVYKKNWCPEFQEELTELEFFSKVKNFDLNTKAHKDNFWKAHTDTANGTTRAPFKLEIPRQGVALNLRNVDDALKAKIALANVKYIAPNWDERFTRPTYKFAIVDENKTFDSKKELLDKVAKTIVIYANEYAGNPKKLRDFITVHNPLKKISKDMNLNALETIVGELAKDNPDEFMKVHEDKFFLLKVKISKAIEVGYIVYATKTTYKTVNDEPLGTMNDIIAKCLEDTNFLNRIEKEIQDK